MYKIGDKVETPLGIGVVVGKRVAMRHDDIIFEVENKGIKVDFRNTHVTPYRTAHEKLIEMGWEYSDRQSGKLHKVYYIENPNDNQKYELVFDKYEHGWVYNLNNEIIVDIILSRILTQYLEELGEKKE